MNLVKKHLSYVVVGLLSATVTVYWWVWLFELLKDGTSTQITFHLVGGVIQFGFVVWLVLQMREGDVNRARLLNELDDSTRQYLLDDGVPVVGNEEDMVKRIIGYLKNAATFVKEIGKGNYSALLEGLNDLNLSRNSTNLAGELLLMRKQMKQVAEDEKKRNRATAGMAELGELLRERSLQSDVYFDNVLRFFVKFLDANQGALFLLKEEDGQESVLKMEACYAYDRKKYLNMSISPGEGLVGQAFLEQDIIYLTEVPNQYIRITSGLGDSLPKCVIIVPLLLNDKVEGVLEIASFRVFEQYEIDFLKKACESVASMVAGFRISERTARLLDESQIQAEQLRAQEEEMRQNLEELAATQEEMDRKQRDLALSEEKSKAILDTTPGAILTINTAGKIDSFNLSARKMFEINGNGLLSIEQIVPGLKASVIEANMQKGSFEQQAVTLTGKKFDAEIFLNQFEVNGEKMNVVVISDVTDKKEKETQIKLMLDDSMQTMEELRAQEEELRQNMEELNATQEEINRQLQENLELKADLDARINVLNTTTIMSEADIYGTILYCNDKLCEVSQYSREELIGKGHNVFRHPDMPKEAFKMMWETIKAGKTFRGIVKNRKKDGTHYWVDAVISPVFDADGNVKKYIGVRYVIERDEIAQKMFDEMLVELRTKNALKVA